MSIPVRLRPKKSASVPEQWSLMFVDEAMPVPAAVPAPSSVDPLATMPAASIDPVAAAACEPITNTVAYIAPAPAMPAATGGTTAATAPCLPSDVERPETLSDIMALLGGKQPRSRKRADMRSALRTVARVLDRPLNTIAASPTTLRLLIADATPSLAGLTPARWARVRSLLITALNDSGIRVMRGRAAESLSASWQALCTELPGKRYLTGLSRFMSFCSQAGIAPAGVDASAFARFQASLLETSLHATPDSVYRSTVRIWHDARAQVSSLPDVAVTLSPDPRRYALPWDHFPDSFRADADAFLAHSGDQDPLADAYAPSVKPSTVAMRRKQVLQLASALVASGKDPAFVVSLAVLVHPPNAQAALRHLLSRNSGKISPFIGQQAQLLRTIGRHWVKAPPADIESLRKYVAGLTIKGRNMGERSRRKMRQFTLPENIDAILSLPHRVLKEVQAADTGSRKDALRLMLALAVEILIASAVRIDNLTALDLEQHFIEFRRGRARIRHLVLPAHMSKTSSPFEMPLPDRTGILLDAYVTTFRLQVSAEPAQWLFPSHVGTRRSTVAFSRAISEFIARETGIDMTPQLFRQLMVKIYLDAHPHDIESPRRMLTHNSATTTQRSYAEQRTEGAFRRYDETLKSRLEGAAATLPKRDARNLKDHT